MNIIMPKAGSGWIQLLTAFDKPTTFAKRNNEWHRLGDYFTETYLFPSSPISQVIFQIEVSISGLMEKSGKVSQEFANIAKLIPFQEVRIDRRTH